MSVVITILLWIGVICGVLGCGLFAGLEIGVYSLNRVRLHTLTQLGNRHAAVLSAMVASPGSVIATILICTNIFTNLAASCLGLILESRELLPWQVIALDVLLLTPVLVVVSEVLPKDLFGAYADRLVYPLVPVLVFCRKALTWVGLVPLLTRSSDFAMWAMRTPKRMEVFTPRRQMGMLMKEGLGPGLVSDEQSAIVERVLELSSHRVADHMTAWPKVVKVNADDESAVLWELAERGAPSRFPVVDRTGAALGVVSLYDALKYSKQACPPIRHLLHTTPTLEHDLPLRPALARMRQARATMAIVVERGRLVGIITVKDLVETITGELTSW